MTLGYMLSDRAILADVQRIQRELVIMMAVDAINDADQLAGAKGEQVRRDIQTFLRAKGKSKLDVQDVYELADEITQGGRTFRQIAPGVICSVPFLDKGPCGEGRGVKWDPSNCQSNCTHRLVFPNRLDYIDSQIGSMLEALERALQDNNEGQIAVWIPQIQNFLYEAKETYDKWVLHPLIQKHFDLSKRTYFSREGFT